MADQGYQALVPGKVWRERNVPIWMVPRHAPSAASDSEMAQLLADSDRERLERMNHHAEFLEERGYLRDDMTTSEAPTSCGSAAP
jgi:hypothetical protein